MAMRGARRRLRPVLAVAAALASMPGCDSPGEALPTRRQIALGFESASTLGIDGAGRFWVGRPGEAVGLDSTGAAGVRVRVGSGAAPELLGETADALHLRAGDTLIAVWPASGERRGARAGFARVPVLPDARGRFIYQGAGSGAVLGFDPATLDPVWGWAARGARTTALAAAPEGDVVWQALASDGGDARILERDVQTGRILIDLELDAPVHGLVTAAGGDVFAALGDGPRVEVVRLRSRAGALTRVWRAVARLEGEGEVRLLHAPGARALAVFRAGSDAGLRVLDTEDGSPLGSVEETPLDAAFAPDGALYLLRADAIRGVRVAGG